MRRRPIKVTQIHSAEYQAFLKRLIAARKSAGLKQWEVAALIGQNQVFVSKCERGERQVDIIEAAKFARVYHVGLDYLAGAGKDSIDQDSVDHDEGQRT